MPIDLKQLQQLGLTERESKVYLALISHRTVMAPDIPGLVSIPRNKIPETVQRLVQLGLVTQRMVERKKAYEAIRPDDAIQHLLERIASEIEVRRQAGLALEAQLMAVYQSSHDTPNVEDYITYLQTPTQIIRVIEELHDSISQREVLWVNKAPYMVSPGMIVAENRALSRGVRYRCIYEEAECLRDDEWLKRSVYPYIEAGEEARVHPQMPIRLGVVDRQISLIQFVDPMMEEHRMTIMIKNEGISQAFAACFEFYWQQSMSFDEFLKTPVNQQ